MSAKSSVQFEVRHAIPKKITRWTSGKNNKSNWQWLSYEKKPKMSEVYTIFIK